ncbi:SLATT domain-containing protein [Leptolyngbya sp. FACHB-541]|uniref:SLATT domain-containing protein n=1 Tax=Leptolyngbya sp. FACHB-541 TaxID=2692810 RepID=UPI001685A2A1|nr:SLATT domain-containing protein [Leptolyngbya sp. FACHB-541]MBD2000608.1 SLATT domain-containing protein [Leptolyngbya sp. FACHB-541]
MNRDNLLKLIAETAYNVGFGAKKHLATFDIVVKVPGLIRLFSITVGIYSLAFNGLSSRFLSASLIILGIISLYISFYDSQKDKYEEVGVSLIQLFNELKKLYFHVKEADDDALPESIEKLTQIESEYYQLSISKQILFSDWYTHYKFFWQYQIDWLDEQKHFRLFRDKIPLSFLMMVLFLSIALAGWIFTSGAIPLEQVILRLRSEFFFEK